MACIEEKPTFKHYCRICKKGFMCGRALGGHMRAHGIGDESARLDDDDDEQASDWEDKNSGFDGTRNRRMYKLRTNPNRLKSCRVCEHCGKEFLSWKSFLEHGKCSYEDAESLISSPESAGDRDGDYDYEEGERTCHQWFKRKRSVRAKVGSFNSTYTSSEEEDLLLAKCLMDLANARFETDQPEESSASASKEEERRYPSAFLGPLRAKASSSKGVFECKSCKKVFNSHQALGGHTASHKKVKGCFASRQDYQIDDAFVDEDVITHEEYIPFKSTTSRQYENGPNISGSASRKKSKVHECTICHRIFSTGQALGGHKRCHWMQSTTTENGAATTLSKMNHFHYQNSHEHEHEHDHTPNLDTKSQALDLNLPAQVDQDTSGTKREQQNPLSVEVFTDIRLQIWTNADSEAKDDHNQQEKQAGTGSHDKKNNDTSNTVNAIQTIDDEADSKVKMEKISELKGKNATESFSPWLQVGIGSTNDASTDP